MSAPGRPRNRNAVPGGASLNGDVSLEAMNVTAGDVRPLLAILAGGILGPAREWQDGALCQQADPEAWFPERGQPTRQPKAVCRRCPARAGCLGWALEHGEEHGVWGGLSCDEREAAAPRYAAGVPLGDIIAGADAAWDACLAAAAGHNRDLSRRNAGAYRARLAAREPASPVPQPEGRAA